MTRIGRPSYSTCCWLWAVLKPPQRDACRVARAIPQSPVNCEHPHCDSWHLGISPGGHVLNSAKARSLPCRSKHWDNARRVFGEHLSTLLTEPAHRMCHSMTIVPSNKHNHFPLAHRRNVVAGWCLFEHLSSLLINPPHRMATGLFRQQREGGFY